MSRYSGCPELFTRLPGPMAITYDEAVAEDAWKRLSAFLDQHLS